MKRLATALILINVLACGSESKDSGANLVAAESETTTTDTETTKETTENKEATTEDETETMNPDAYPVAEGFTKIAVSSFQAENISWRMKFDVDFQCSGAVEIRGEFINAGYVWWVSYTEPSQPTSWVNGFKVSQLKPAEHEDAAVGYNLQSRVLYKCL